MWEAFGEGTIKCMQDGVHLLAVLWQSAWVAGDGDNTIPSSALRGLTKQKAMSICQDSNFLPSTSVGKIAPILRKPI